MDKFQELVDELIDSSQEVQKLIGEPGDFVGAVQRRDKAMLDMYAYHAALQREIRLLKRIVENQ